MTANNDIWTEAYEFGLHVGMAKGTFIALTGDDKRASAYDQLGELVRVGRFSEAATLLGALGIDLDMANALASE